MTAAELSLSRHLRPCPWGHVGTDDNGEHGQTIYALLGADGQVLYIGRTSNLRRRLAAHRRNKPWWSHVARVRALPVCCIDKASRAELAAFRAIRPAHGVDPRESAARGHATRRLRAVS